MPDALSAPNSRVIASTATDNQIQWSKAVFGAILAHVALVVALTVSIDWRQTEQTVVFEAELISGVIEEAAPKPVPAPPVPEPVAQPAPPPPPPPPPAPEPEKAAPPAPSAADIALAEKKKAEEQEAKEKAARERAERERAAQEAAAKAKAEKEKAAREKAAREKAAKEKAAREKAAREKAARDKAAREKAAKEKFEREKAAREKAAKERAALEKAAHEKAAREKAEAERQQAILQQIREEQLARTRDLVGQGSNPASKGTATVSKGPSASYGAKVDAFVRPNIVFAGTISGNPPAMVEVTSAPNGEILGRKLITSSGNPSWDEAVLRGLDRTGRLPKDEDGSVPSPLRINFYPKK